jgi:putative ABC transport system permease protein
MLRNYLQIIIRIAARNKIVTAFSLLGLAIGIAAAMLIALYVKKELSHDRFHQHADNLYRVTTQFASATESFANAHTPAAILPAMRAQFPVVAAGTRLFRYRSEVVLLNKESNKHFTEANFLWADPGIFDVFTIPLLNGDPAKALSEPGSVIIAESMARKYFGDADPLGRLLRNVTFNIDFRITGVFKDLPGNSHFKADFFCTLATLQQLWGEGMMSNWYNSFLYTYIRLKEDAGRVEFTRSLNLFASHHMPLPPGNSITFSLQPITSIHLGSQLLNEAGINSNRAYVYVLSVVGILILLISCINFVNLGIARAHQRSKEIGVRKVFGSSTRHVSIQYIVENLLYGAAAFAVALVLVVTLSQGVNAVAGGEISLTAEPVMLLAGFLAVLLIVLITSVYPAVFIAGIKVIEVLRARPVKIARGMSLWKGLISFQLCATVFLLVACLVLNKQLNFLHNRPLGYATTNNIHIPLLTDESQAKYTQLKTQLLQNPEIQAVSATSHLIGGQLYQSGYEIQLPGKERSVFTWQRFHADFDFLKANQLALAAGRDFSASGDTTHFIINEAACRAIGLSPQQAVGMQINQGRNRTGSVIGVMRDFHFKSLHHTIEPLIVHYEPGRFRFLTVNISSASRPEAMISFLQQAWNRFEPLAPFVYSFPDQFTSSLYASENRLRRIITVFTVIAFLLSVGGLIGINYYTIQLKTREIGILKVLGADLPSLIVRLSRNFIKMMMLAFVIALPVSWWAASQWLQDFAYRTENSWQPYAVAGAITAFIVLSTISFQAIKAALRNPVKSLRSE